MAYKIDVTLKLSLTARQFTALADGLRDMAQEAKDDAMEHDTSFFEGLYDLLYEFDKYGSGKNDLGEAKCPTP